MVKIVSFVLLLLLPGLDLYLFPGTGATAKVARDGNLNVLLITLDTMRADRIGAYGWSKARTPNIDALAAGGVRFANAYCPAPLTLPSHCSILTGTYPLYHKVRNNGSYYLAPEAVTLAERLRDRGFRTSAFVASFNVDSRFGVDQGFAVYDDRVDDEQMLKTFRSERRGDKVADAFIRWLEGNAESRFFSWVHFFDPHMPHDPPSPYKEEFAGNLYDGEVAFMDHELGRVIDALRTKGVLDRTLVVIAGDHGEALGEKEELDHGIFIYDGTMKVPMIFYANKRLPGSLVIDSRIRLIDLMPSVLDMLKIPLNPEVQGESLLPFIEGSKNGDLTCYLESYYPPETFGWSELVGIIDGNWKFIRAPRSELYDLKTDAKEEKDIASREARTATLLNRKLEDIIKAETSKAAPGRRTLSRDEEDRLRSLGYIGADASVKIGKGPLPDPKDKMGEYKILFKAKLLEYQGNFEESEKYYREILRLEPDVSWHYIGLAILLAKERKVGDGIEVLKSGLARLPDSVILMSRLASFYMRAGNFKEAFAMSRATLKRDPRHLDALVIAGWSEDMRGSWKESAGYFGKALEIEPENKYTRLKYAYALGALGRGEEAARMDEALKKEYPDDPRVHADLGTIYASMNKLDLAEANLRKAAELKPGPEAYLSYSAILERTGKLKDAITYLKLFLDTAKEGDTPRIIKARNALAEWERRLKAR
jgi:arylsulfatase A-like enzyme/Tfp pilus assembly protein PilF